MQNPPTYQSLQARWERSWRTYPDNLQLRLRRSISWLGRAECEMNRNDHDAAFIFYWIAFNAAYAEGHTESELRARRKYLRKVIKLDTKRGSDIHRLLEKELLASITTLLDNKYLFDPFWNYYKRKSGYDDWEKEFDRNRCRAYNALDIGDTMIVLHTLFERLTVLRNQLLHGGATWDGSVNRPQVENGARIMASLIPQFVDLMMKNPRRDWGKNFYPLIGVHPLKL